MLDLFLNLFDLFLHLDDHLQLLLIQYGAWTYAILFIIVFCETGLVVTPFLPGDSLLFAAGAFSASGLMSGYGVSICLIIAAVLGDAANYSIGRYLGPKMLQEKRRWLKQEYLDRTHQFYERYGGKTIVIARFVPIIRTFAPFLAGVGSMSYARFATYNVVGAVLWVVVCVGSGYFFGNLQVVKENFSLVILMIIFLSILPAGIEFLRHSLIRSHKELLKNK